MKYKNGIQKALLKRICRVYNVEIVLYYCIKDGMNIDIIVQKLIQFNYFKKCYV